MMRRGYLKKKAGSAVLASAMLVTAFSTLSTNVYAAEKQLPAKEEFATVEELKLFDTDDTDAEGANPAKIYFGNEKHQWWIAGSQNDNLTLFAASSPFGDTDKRFDEGDPDNTKPYSADWNCTYPSGTVITEVYPNHYGASTIRTLLKDLETSYFTTEEQELMNPTTIYTLDEKYLDDGHSLEESVYSTTDKLYLATGINDDRHIIVGENSAYDLNGGLRVDRSYWANKDSWLRTPFLDDTIKYNLIARTTGFVDHRDVHRNELVVPAFELNSSSILFASAVPAVSAEGSQAIQDTDGEGAFTLRYRAENLGVALISYDMSKVTVTLPEGAADTYLVVQNSDGAFAKPVTAGETSVNAAEMGLESFDNCKVWLETTDVENRITSAVYAVVEEHFDLEISSEITFDELHEGYQEAVFQNATIKNTGNVDVTNINAVLTGADADVFTLDTAGMLTSLAPNETTSFALKPNEGLGVGTYTAQVQITGDTGISKSFEVSVTVEGHEYESVVTPPTCTSKGYTTHTCTICNHSYTDSETEMLSHEYKKEWKSNETGHWKECDCGAKSDEAEHTFKWVVDKKATTTEKGSKHEECEICGYKKDSVEIPVVKSDKTDTNKSNDNKASVKTGDQENIGRYMSLAAISVFCIAVLGVLKKKRNY